MATFLGWLVLFVMLLWFFVARFFGLLREPTALEAAMSVILCLVIVWTPWPPRWPWPPAPKP